MESRQQDVQHRQHCGKIFRKKHLKRHLILLVPFSLVRKTASGWPMQPSDSGQSGDQDRGWPLRGISIKATLVALISLRGQPLPEKSRRWNKSGTMLLRLEAPVDSYSFGTFSSPWSPPPPPPPVRAAQQGGSSPQQRPQLLGPGSSCTGALANEGSGPKMHKVRDLQ
jgi:hypothetical protein